MPSPTNLSSSTNRNQNRHGRSKPWFTCLAIILVPIYVLTLFLIGYSSTNDKTLVDLDVDGALSSIIGATPPVPANTGDDGSHLYGKNSSSRQSSSSSQPSYQSIAREIAARWNLSSPEAPYLLEQQFYRVNDYNPETDFLHFHHIPKTGGTSISDMINATLGALADGHRGVLPGSDRSGSTDRKKFYMLTGLTPGNNTNNMVFPYLASYGHTRLRPIHGPNKTELASFFEEYFALPNNSPKRLRSLAMLREPMDLRASTYAMGLCGLNGRINTFNRKRAGKGLPRICTPEQGLNISELHDELVEELLAKCPNRQKGFKDLDRHGKIICRGGRNALDICRSPAHLLQSGLYKNQMRSLLKGLMGRYTGEEGMDSHLYAYVKDLVKTIGMKFSLQDVEENTLIDLGGLDSNIKHTPYNGYDSQKKQIVSTSDSNGMTRIDDDAEPDFLWFGITERMKESTCLFYYTLRVKPLPATPRARVMQCSTTSWWTEEQRDQIKRSEPADYALWRAANAIMDARVVKMQEDIESKLQSDQGLAEEERDQYQALADAGCIDSM